MSSASFAVGKAFEMNLPRGGDSRCRGSSAPLTAEELAAIAAFPEHKIRRIPQGQFLDPLREELFRFKRSGGITKLELLERKRELAEAAE